MNIPALCLYFIGVMLVLSVFEPDEEGSPVGLVIFAFLWPIVTLHTVFLDLFFPDQE